MATQVPVTGETPITIKISYGETVKKLKLPLKDLTAEVLPVKLTALLNLPTNKKVTYERFSDSAGGYITLDPANSAVYKTLVRAAKAKLKLRLRATVEGMDTNITAPAVQNTVMPATTPALVAPGSASDRKNLGAGIFEFKDARTSNQIQKIRDFHAGRMGEAPVPRPFSMPKPVMTEKLSIRPKSQIVPLNLNGPTWSVYCNNCDAVMHNEHFHCSICDGGDYDLCQGCVDKGKLCPGQGHWLVKRFIKDGQMISSTTERLPPKPKAVPIDAMASKPTNAREVPALSAIMNSAPSIPEPKTLAPRASYTSFAPIAPIPGAFTDDTKTLREESIAPTRTCNSCVDVLDEHMFVTCRDCEDYDVCIKCHTRNKHGHHPGHTFTPATNSRKLTPHQQSLAAPGRNTRHAALCDGCDKPIAGVRHKCFECPDFDYCNDCRRSAHLTHPGHRFAPLYEPIEVVNKPAVKHIGIYCDGPACSSNPCQSYLQGVRYKCAVCHDRDYCASCEASPNNPHNKSHPMLKITTPIRSLEITTMDDVRREMRHTPTVPKQIIPVSKPAAPANTPSSVKTVAHIEPTPAANKAIEVTKFEDIKTFTHTTEGLQASFVNDTIPDGIVVRANTRFTQVWTMRNTGSAAWPAGCSVRFVGGDNMLNVGHTDPCSAAAMADATESNVIGREVKPGEEVAFKVVLKAPNRPGKAISYWRLKTAEGMPFGHRLWCDINIRMPTEQPEAAPSAPTPEERSTELANRVLRAQQLAARHAERMREFHTRQMEVQARQDSTYKQADKFSKGVKEMQQKVVSEREQALSRRLSEHMAARQAYFQRKVQEMNLAGQELAAQKDVAGPSTEKQAELPKSEPVTVAEPKVEDKKEESNLSESQMVFPTLEKESPASSIHQSTMAKGKAATVEDEETGSITSAEKPSIASSETSTANDESPAEEEVFEDISSEIEVLSDVDSISDDDGFLTDEEYDILDASDDETIASL
ncbi:Ig-like domain-containing protein [Elsinoe fawcettii]|nr:Ig-like domain-containing protein [Elsinoe fawcettii]